MKKDEKKEKDLKTIIFERIRKKDEDLELLLKKKENNSRNENVLKKTNTKEANLNIKNTKNLKKHKKSIFKDFLSSFAEENAFKKKKENKTKKANKMKKGSKDFKAKNTKKYAKIETINSKKERNNFLQISLPKALSQSLSENDSQKVKLEMQNSLEKRNEVQTSNETNLQPNKSKVINKINNEPEKNKNTEIYEKFNKKFYFDSNKILKNPSFKQKKDIYGNLIVEEFENLETIYSPKRTVKIVKKENKNYEKIVKKLNFN